uniref:Hemicentin-1 n=1 Tax=Magallana gigas TaxID=29159 RepID=K1S1L6_MAGGI
MRRTNVCDGFQAFVWNAMAALCFIGFQSTCGMTAEGNREKVRCVVNSNAVPAPTITWYLGSRDITSKVGTDTTSITLTGNRTDNTKTLECRATNNNRPLMTASLTLNVEFYWTKVDNSGFRQNGATLRLLNIQRNSSGTYRCTAENNYSNGEKGTASQSVVVNVLYPPTFDTLSQRDVIEERNISITCTATPGNPSFTFWWTKVDNPGFIENGATIQLSNIQRNNSGTYRCTAENNYSNGKKGTDSQLTVVNVQYPPTIKTLSQQNIVERGHLSFTCKAIPGNPSSTTVYWTKVDNSGFRQNGATLELYNIQRNSYGTYRCTAENNYSNGEKGTVSQPMVVNVLYQPTIEKRSLQIVNESEEITLIRDIGSNPLSNASWYDGKQMLKTEISVKTATLTIENTMCTDTKNYTLVVSNGIGNTVTAMVDLIVNCKPMPDTMYIILGVTCTTRIEFSTTLMAYPEPFLELQYENGTKNDQMKINITEIKVNNFSIRIRQDGFEENNFGVYHLRASNNFGETTVIVNVIKQRKPDIPRNITVTCKVTGAIVQWISSFNGGSTQNFTVITLSGQDGTSIYLGLNDKGENEIHVTYQGNLKPSVTYCFFVSAKNSHGSSLSKAISCTTVKETTSSLTGVFAGGVVGALVLVTIILILVFFVHRRYTFMYKCCE